MAGYARKFVFLPIPLSASVSSAALNEISYNANEVGGRTMDGSNYKAILGAAIRSRREAQPPMKMVEQAGLLPASLLRQCRSRLISPAAVQPPPARETKILAEVDTAQQTSHPGTYRDANITVTIDI